MKKARTIFIVTALSIIAGYGLYRYINSSDINPNPRYTLDQPLDSLNGVVVYYNGMVGRTNGRNMTADGYNIGMKHQCVEFVKRYYYERLHHKMPDAFGNAKDFFDRALPDSSLNAKRGLLQFANASRSRPREEDLLIFDGHTGNTYGHVAIVSDVTDSTICIIQQNPGPFGKSRDTFSLQHSGDKWTIINTRVLGWLRKDTVIIVKQS